jgi:aminotransferase
MKEIAQRAMIPRSATVGIENRAAEMKRAGVDVISLAAGQPDFPTPQHIREYAKKALDEGYTFYPPSPGLPELREAISKKVVDENGIEADPGSEIIVTVGGKQAVFSTILALVDQGDEVIIADPSWVTYEPCVRLAGGKIVPVPVHEKNQFRLNKDDVARAVTPRTKLIVINSPNNPTGSVLRQDDLKEIADMACAKDLFVLSDEIYEYMVYDGLKHHSIASIPGMKERTITANGFSKAYSMTGWRLGYLVGPKQIVQHILAIHEHSVTGPSSFSQRAAAQGMNDPRSKESVRSMVAEFERRRNVIVEGLNKISKVSCVRPNGAFYAFANISALGKSSMEVAGHLLEKALVATVPGAAFGPRGEGFLRLSFANSTENIRKALDRMGTALGEL